MGAETTHKGRSYVSYALMPQIFPRLKKLFGGGFGHLPYFIVAVFNTLRIIPDDHLYLRKTSQGHYSIFQALAAAANHIPFNRKNIDKITIFGVVLTGLAMMALQILLLILALFTGRAMAYNGPGLGPRTIGAFFDNPNTETDLSFRLLDLVFGIPDIFNSSEMGTTPFHAGLHALFEFYSYGILLVATIVIVYLTIAIVMETSESGIPFGKRFNKAWVPIRIVLFFGLLLPVPPGINLAQYLLLNGAKLGSNMASNAWLLFDSTSSSAYLGTPDQLIARPNTPDFTALMTFMAVAKTCSWSEGRVSGHDVQPYLVYGAAADQSVHMDTEPAFSEIADNIEGGTLIFRFGVKDPELYPNELGAVRALCGELSLPLTDQAQPGSAIIHQAYIEMVRCMWDGTSGSVFQCNMGDRLDLVGQRYTEKYSGVPPFTDPDMTLVDGSYLRTFLVMSITNSFDAAIEQAITEQTTPAGPDAANSFENPRIAEYGWAGAGIWFNKIAEQNGAFTTAIFNQPQVRKMPEVMEFTKTQKMQQDTNVPLMDMYSPFMSSGIPLMYNTPHQRDVAVVLNQVFTKFADERMVDFFPNNPVSHTAKMSGNIIIDTINMIMGTQGLFDMCRNNNVHPLAQLSSIGKGLVEHSIRSFGIAAGVGLLAGVTGLIQPGIGASLKAITGFFTNIASIGLMLGIVLYYVLPFLPFIYFFFAVMTWVKSIFEAMVGMPLWALAHIRIDSEGMPGDAAEAGYFYILEIFLRPIFIIISFVGAIVIFGALVKVLNQIFYLVISNLAGHTPSVSTINCFNPPSGAGNPAITETAFKRGPVDEFFYTIIYAIIVYMMAAPCFKLVDAVPDRIMRWLGSGISSFGAQDGDPADGLVKNVVSGLGIIGGKLQGSAAFAFFK